MTELGNYIQGDRDPRHFSGDGVDMFVIPVEKNATVARALTSETRFLRDFVLSNEKYTQKPGF